MNAYWEMVIIVGLICGAGLGAMVLAIRAMIKADEAQ